MSPLPFGVHRVPVMVEFGGFDGGWAVSIAFRRSPRSGPTRRAGPTPERHPVSIAFRRSPRSGREWDAAVHFSGRSVSIAFRRSPRSGRKAKAAPPAPSMAVSIAFRRSPRSGLSGNTQTTKGHGVSIAFRRSPRSGLQLDGSPCENDIESPLPFGVHRVPDELRQWMIDSAGLSLHCLSAFTAFRT